MSNSAILNGDYRYIYQPNSYEDTVWWEYGTPETTTGGNALKFYSSVRIDVRKIATLKQNDEPIGNRTKAKVVKNKVAPPI